MSGLKCSPFIWLERKHGDDNDSTPLSVNAEYGPSWLCLRDAGAPHCRCSGDNPSRSAASGDGVKCFRGWSRHLGATSGHCDNSNWARDHARHRSVLERATYAEAIAAERRTPITPHEHPFPMCFGCGTDRAPGDGLRLCAGPLIPQNSSGAFAVPWIPDPSLTATEGLIAPEFVWSALECPAAHVWVCDEKVFVLGRFSLRIDRPPRPGEQCVVTSWRSGREGRRLIAETALFGEDENLLAVGRAIFFVVDLEVHFGKR
jgi:hypothetical protein